MGLFLVLLAMVLHPATALAGTIRAVEIGMPQRMNHCVSAPPARLPISAVKNGIHAVLPMSALLGGGFLLGMDNIARFTGTFEIPLGILTALIGAPFFALVLARSRKQWF